MADHSYINDKPVTLANMVLLLVQKKSANVQLLGQRGEKKAMKCQNSKHIVQKKNN